MRTFNLVSRRINPLGNPRPLWHLCKISKKPILALSPTPNSPFPQILPQSTPRRNNTHYVSPSYTSSPSSQTPNTYPWAPSPPPSASPPSTSQPPQQSVQCASARWQRGCRLPYRRGGDVGGAGIFGGGRVGRGFSCWKKKGMGFVSFLWFFLWDRKLEGWDWVGGVSGMWRPAELEVGV